MALYVAVPMAADGSDRTDAEAREATVSGDYLSIANFRRYAFARRATLPGQYNLYLVEGVGRRLFLFSLYSRV